CCAGLYAAVLGGMAIAQDPAATSTGTPEASQTPAEQAFTPTPTASAQTPTSTSTATPTQTATQTATPTVSSTPFTPPASSATPYPSPVQTVVGSPTPGATATPGSLGLDLSRKKNKRRNGHSGNGSIVDEGCLDGDASKKSKKKKKGDLVGSVVDSTSTIASECDLLNSNAPDD